MKCAVVEQDHARTTHFPLIVGILDVGLQINLADGATADELPGAMSGRVLHSAKELVHPENMTAARKLRHFRCVSGRPNCHDRHVYDVKKMCTTSKRWCGVT
eukprot:3412784-Rhodomonas_salina.3